MLEEIASARGPMNGEANVAGAASKHSHIGWEPGCRKL